MSKKVCFVPRHVDYSLDCQRSALGLAVENMYAYCAIVGVELPEMDDYNKENLDWIRDMEGEVYSTEDHNVSVNGMAKISIEELGQKLKEMDVVVPYGIV